MASNIPHLFDSFQETWHPRLVAAVNDHDVKIAKIDGPFIWHSHPNTDELFYLCSGKLTLELEGQEPVLMKQGDVYVVPRGLRHRPVAENAHVLVVEQKDTVNTGDEEDSPRTRQVKDIRPGP